MKGKRAFHLVLGLGKSRAEQITVDAKTKIFEFDLNKTMQTQEKTFMLRIIFVTTYCFAMQKRHIVRFKFLNVFGKRAQKKLSV